MVERRTFLKGSALAAGVALLEACGGDDVQYLVQPLERPEGRPGEGVWKQSVCGQCSAGCGTVVRVVDGDARKVEGLRAHPINHGGLCALGQAALQAHYDPDRVTAPMVRRGAPAELAGSKTDAQPKDRSAPLEAVEWDAALAAAAEAIAAAATHDPSSIVFVDGSGNTFLHALLVRLARAIGAPAPIALEPSQLEVERRAAAIALGFDREAAYDLPRSDYILSIGPAFLDRGAQPAWSTWAMGQVRGGTPGRRGKLVQAEARMSLTAAFADEWLPVVPGEEGTLARTLAGVILAEAPARGDAAGYRAVFAEEPPSLEEGARRCDVPAKTIRRVARELLRAERPVVLGGGTAAVQVRGLDATIAALALNLLLGAVRRAGGVYPSATFGVASTLLPAGAGAAMSATALEARLRGIGDPPRVLVVCEGDPAHTRPGSRGWREGLGRLETIITLTTALDDTTTFADVVLPIHSDVERFQAVEPAGLPFPVLSLAKPVVKALGDSRHPGDIVLALATALERKDALPWESFEAMVEQTVTAAAPTLPAGAATDASQLWTEAVERGGVWIDEIPAAPAISVGASIAPQQGTPVLRSPIVAEPVASKPASGAPNAGTPTEGLTLLLFESPKYGDGRGANKAWLQELPDTLTTVMWNGWAEIASRDAERLGIATGDQVELTTEAGSIEVPAVVRPEARPGTIALPLGPGHRDYGRYARGRGSNPLDLIGADNVEGTTSPVLSGRVRISRTGKAKLALYGRGLREAEHIPTGWAPMKRGH
ncbi:MAG TPA: molybdopterin dinucleotide binding domain-containing protein [Thermoanaerobaculia bacterium]|nr:molybdopterin dinucleotide binding domain-containing protein [Thermoanaerobaculia bacterium]